LGNQFAPAGLVLNKFTVQNAFSISGRAFYAEYHFSDKVIEELSSPEGTILALRRVRHQDATSGYFTVVVVGCYHIDHLPDEQSACLVDSGQNNLGRASVRAEEPFNLPLRISSNLLLMPPPPATLREIREEDRGRHHIAYNAQPPLALNHNLQRGGVQTQRNLFKRHAL
jgi:hypothetical protein